ncbi:putative ribonuclease H-like domain-containing protein [Tanacetum coccineum]
MFRGRIPALSFIRPFRCPVTILNSLDYLSKFDGKSDEGFFLGYLLNSKAFRVYNIRTRIVEENLHIRFLEDKHIIIGDGPKWLFDIDVLTKSMNYVPVVAGTNSNDLVDGSLFDSSLKNASNDEPQPSSDAKKKDDEGVNKESGINDQERLENSNQDVHTARPSINTANTNVNIGSLNINILSPTVTTAPLEATQVDYFGDETKLDMSNITTTYLVLSTLNTRIHKDHSLDHVIGDVQSGVQTKRMKKTTNEQGFIGAIYEGKTLEDLPTCLFAYFLSQEDPKKVWTLVDLPHDKRAIGTKWVYRNKKDKRGIVIRNKARLVTQGYTQEEGIYYDEIFAPVTKIEAIRLFLAYASFKDFVVYQMDVKSALLYGKIEEEVYVCQPPRFEDPEFLDRVYKVEKALYGLHQAPRAWVKSDILLVQMSSMDELTFFLGLQVTQKDNGIFINQDKYVDGILKKFGFSTVKTASTPMETSKPLMKDENDEDVNVYLYRSMIGSLMYLTSSRPDIMFDYPKDSPFELEAYTDSDYVGASLDRKSTIGEYVVAASFYRQVLWIKNQMMDYGYNFMNTKIFIDNESTICIVKNPVFHSKTKTAANDEIQVSDVGLTYYYALTVNPTIYTSCIKQFWVTAKAKTINGEVQIQALVDGKKVIFTETSVRRALQLKDAEGTECLLNATIFEQLTLIGYENLTQKLTFYKVFFSHQWKFLIHTILQCISAKTTAWNEFSSTMASTVICLATNQKFNFSKYIFDNMVKKLEGGCKYSRFVQVFLDKQIEGMSKHKNIYVTPSHTKKVFANMKRGGKGFFGRFTPTMMVQAPEELENTKTSQAAKITKLKERAKKLERRNESRTLGLNRLRKVGRSAQVVSSKDEVFDEQEVEVEKAVSTTEVTTVSAITTTVDELTLGQTLIKIKVTKPKAVTIAATTTTTVAKDKCKAKMIEPEKPLKKKDQILIVKEIAQKLQAQLNAELEEEEKLAKQREEDANMTKWDNFQAMINTDYELAARLQAQEQEELTVEENSKLFVELMDKRKMHFARLRAEEQRRKPPTKA